MAEARHTIDMTQGPIFSKLLFFVYPLLCTYALQSIFSAVDMVIVGRFCSYSAMAAIGATVNPITLMMKIFIGLSTGANAVIAMYYGARNHVRFHEGTHTSMALAVYGGLCLTAVCLWVTKPLLVLMNTPSDILHAACVYSWIFYLGVPFMMIFNFGSAILRAVGDSKRPMYYLTYAGVLNVLLNLLFVLVFKMDVAGVAVATTLSNGLAAGLIIWTLSVSNDSTTHIVWKKVRFHWKSFKEILWIGIPAAINSSFYNIANMFIQTALNTFGSMAIAGCAAASAVESLVSMFSTAFQQASMTFVAQNFGAQDYRRVVRSSIICLIVSAGASLILGNGIYLFGETVIGWFNSDLQVIQWGMEKLSVMLTLLFIGCIMDVSVGCLRGLGYSMSPAIASFLGACVFRIIWVLYVFPRWHSLRALMLCYPISWAIIALFDCVMLYFIIRHLFSQKNKPNLHSIC